MTHFYMIPGELSLRLVFEKVSLKLCPERVLDPTFLGTVI